VTKKAALSICLRHLAVENKSGKRTKRASCGKWVPQPQACLVLNAWLYSSAYKLGYFFIRRTDLRNVLDLDAVARGFHGDHRAIMMRMRIRRSIWRTPS
jgi:hypothetical protein